MNAKGSFTDFAQAPGGASAWHTVWLGSVTFLLAAPSKENVAAFDENKGRGPSGKGNFLGDVVESMCSITISPGHTLFIPAGWIVARQHPEDSVSFSGLFLHGHSIPEQLGTHGRQLLHGHDTLPFFTRLHWFVARYYVFKLRQAQGSKAVEAAGEGQGAPTRDADGARESVLSAWELQGLPSFVHWLETSAPDSCPHVGLPSVPVANPARMLQELRARVDAEAQVLQLELGLPANALQATSEQAIRESLSAPDDYTLTITVPPMPPPLPPVPLSFIEPVQVRSTRKTRRPSRINSDMYELAMDSAWEGDSDGGSVVGDEWNTSHNAKKKKKKKKTQEDILGAKKVNKMPKGEQTAKRQAETKKKRSAALAASRRNRLRKRLGM